MKKLLFILSIAILTITAISIAKLNSKKDTSNPQPVKDTSTPKSVRVAAEDVFSQGKFYCSEAVVHSINNVLKEPYPEEITRTASAFPVGLGKAKSLCGAVSGGEIALGMVYGRTLGEKMNPKMLPFAKELHDFIKTKYGSVLCAKLVEPYDFKSAERKKLCVGLTGDVAEWVAEKLESDTLNATIFDKSKTTVYKNEQGKFYVKLAQNSNKCGNCFLN